MKRSRLLSISLLLILQQASWAGPRTYQQAQAIAERQAAQMGVTISQQARVRSFNITPTSSEETDEALTQSGTPAYYVFPYGENLGFSIVSGDDQMPELVAYSDKGTLDKTNMPGQFRDFLKAYMQVAEAVAKGDKQALRMMAQKRGLLASADYQQPTVEPLLGNIAWGASDPFNSMCPAQRRAGYAAVAMAQLMRYWKYPKELKADIPAYTSDFKHAIESLNEKYEIAQVNKGETYDWELMIPYYTNKWDSEQNHTPEQAAAVAKLMAHCGAALQTTYSSFYGCESICSAQPFIKYFGYDPDLAHFVNRGCFSYNEWCKLIDEELIAKRPVIYSGNTAYEGRSVVCDGADGKGLYHINWGDSGEGNGYFDISILAKSTGTGFNRDASMIIGLQPDNGVKDEPLVQVQALNVLPDERELTIVKSERTSASDVFTLIYTAIIGNEQPEAFDGLYNVGFKDENGNYKPVDEEHSVVNIEGNSISGMEYYGSKVKLLIEYPFPLGTTKLYDIYSTDGGKSWQPCGYKERSYPFELKATETSLSLVKENDDFQTTLWTTGKLMQNRDCHFSYTMHNQNDHDFFGEVLIYTSKTPDFSNNLDCSSDYVSIMAGGNTTHDFWLYRPKKAGDYYVWLYDVEHDKMLVNAQKFTILPSPKLEFLSKSINVKKDTYEREDAYLYEARVELPVIDGDEAVVKYAFTNVGGDWEGNLRLIVEAYAKDKETYYLTIDKECSIKGYGTTSELEYRFKASDLQGYKSFVCRFYGNGISKYYKEMDFSQIPSNKLYLLDDSERYYTIDEEYLVGYFGDTSTGISSTPTLSGGMKVSAGKGSLSIIPGKAQSVAIYNLAGQCVRRLNLQANTVVNVTLPKGVYVIGKEKVAVK